MLSNKLLAQIDKEIREKDQKIVNLRVRVRGMYNLFGPTCFSCKFMVSGEMGPECNGCNDHRKFVLMFSEVRT